MPSTEEQDESIRVDIAVKALGDMRNSTRIAMSSSPDINSPDFVSRMSHLPLVNSALRVYEQGKASSRVVKYGAEMMESSVKTISRPVIERLPVNVNQLDEFACRQLDRFDRYRNPSGCEPTSPASPSSVHSQSSERQQSKSRLHSKTLDGSPDDPGWDRDNRDVPNWLEANSPFVPPPGPPPAEDEYSRGSTPTQNGNQREDQQQVAVAQRSRWQAVLLEAGGLSAALSEESMRRLKYCLQWLQYATSHIDAQILILRDFIASLQPLPPSRDAITPAHIKTLTDVRSDIVHTIRQVVDVVSRYAGGALPEPARVRVRGFILKLPSRWASRAGVASEETQRDRESVAAASGAGVSVGALRRGNRRAAQRERGVESTGSSRAASPHSSRSSLGSEHTSGTTVVAAQRVLTLAMESLDMMRGVTGVVKDSLDRADAWVGRFRTVGIRGAVDAAAAADEPEEAERDFEHRRRRRGSSVSQSDDQDQDMPSTPYSMSSSSTTYSYSGAGSVPSTPGPVYGQPQTHFGEAPSPDVGLGMGSMSLAGGLRERGYLSLRGEGEEVEVEAEDGALVVRKDAKVDM